MEGAAKAARQAGEDAPSAVERCRAQIDAFLEAETDDSVLSAAVGLAECSDPRSGTLSLRSGEATAAVPVELVRAPFAVFRELLRLIAEDAQPTTAEQLRAAIEDDESLRDLHSRLQGGLLDESYAREAALSARINALRLRQIAAANLAKALRIAELRRAQPARCGAITAAEDVDCELSALTEPGSATEESGAEAEEASELRGRLRGRNAVTVAPATAEELEEFHRQEAARYGDPAQPFSYVLASGERRPVAPVARKTDCATKAREHALLKLERPACVTLLSLVRDAAARLPRGFGSRGDICELLKESQYVAAEGQEEQLSSVVSGALDRLHYERDPCVKFDAHRKLWLSLHIAAGEASPDGAAAPPRPKAKRPKLR